MPVKIEPYREVDEDVRELIANSRTNEAAVLHALTERDEPASADEVAEAVAFDRDAVDGALYRLRRKELVVKSEAGHEVAGDDVELLAEALVVPEENLA